ncbi:hypothetical protein E4K66_30340 [Bradyrhizobium frederickii]|uniref:IrrE N-terminal-like domain-containing protein n=1 Tax=Bradyrhizobium frederickii TaxID=2560054 RepID=A0A4Y9KTI1_9BRAD|nr:hypothetical protein [Bradyrhizobium frederickii]TFV34698.1 hypothetical protein E4K66_30340 [Bradyrhizobium frederickii]
MSGFEISRSWLPRPGKSEADATLARLLIQIEEKIVSDFEDGRGQKQSLEIPAYYLAEWMAENWWPLLWEPEKSEGAVLDPAFTRRHSFLAAQRGFALPNVQIVSAGKLVEVSAAARTSDLAKVRFFNRASVSLDRFEVEKVLRGFIEGVVGRLEEANITDSFLQEAWSLISSTDEDEALFCRLAGALGISPYEIAEPIAELFERLENSLGPKVLLDLCQAATVEDLPEMARVTEQAVSLTKNAPTSTLSPISTFKMPSDNVHAAAHRHGVHTADYLRRRLGIKNTDPNGATKVFEQLHIDPKTRVSQKFTAFDEASVTGAVVRHDDEMKIALLQETETKRRFSAARAIFSAWSAEDNESMLLTSAGTRDQQANRAFAAELTCPLEIVRLRAKSGRLTSDAISDLAAELHIGADVVKKRAADNGIRV